MLVIYFIGLICHVTLSGGNYAALVRDMSGNHRAELFVPAGADVTPASAKKKFRVVRTTAQGEYLDIANHELWITGATGAPVPSSDFKSDVLKLSEVTNGHNPSSDAANKKFAAGAIKTIFDIKGGGPLDVSTYWSTNVDIGAAHKVCVARSTKYEYTAPSGATTVQIESDDGRQLLVALTGKYIRFENNPTDTDPAHAHFGMYKDLTDGSTIDIPKADFTTGHVCNKTPQVVPDKFTTTECSNTQWP